MTRLQSLREAKHWSRAEVARRSGLNASTVGLIECRRLLPYAGQLAKLAKALAGDADGLLDEVDGGGPVQRIATACRAPRSRRTRG